MAGLYVLAVDDDEPTRDLLDVMLGMWDVEHDLLTAGSEVAEAVRTRPPDVLLIDESLLDASGAEVIAHLEEEGLRPPRVVLLSGIEEMDLRERADAVGAGYLTKPFTPATLRAALGVDA